MQLYHLEGEFTLPFSQELEQQMAHPSLNWNDGLKPLYPMYI